MLIQDCLYGVVEIDSPVLVELIGSPTIQRLKGIGQLGVPEEYYHIKGFSRYEHSVGVMLLLKRLGADEEEQIAGLLHDASHTAFSHVIDWVVKDTGGDESFQDENHLSYLKRTDVPEILRRYGYVVDKMADLESFGLLERQTPDICADRIDYALREFPGEVAQKCLNDLTVKNGRIVFRNPETAKLFALNFLDRQITNWGSIEASNRYHYFAKALKIAMEHGFISFDDFWKDDTYVLDKIKACKDPEFTRILDALRAKSLDGMAFTGERSPKLFRHADPLCIHQGNLRHLSEFDLEFKATLEEAKNQNALGVPMLVI
jgi:hypothetical protein